MPTFQQAMLLWYYTAWYMLFRSRKKPHALSLSGNDERYKYCKETFVYIFFHVLLTGK